MHCPSRAIGKGLLRNSFNASRIGMHPHTRPRHVTAARWAVMEHRCCASVFLNPIALPRPPFSPVAALPVSRPQISWLRAKRAVQSNDSRFYEPPFVLRSGGTLLR